MIEDVLAVARPPPHATDQANDFLMKSVHAARVRSALAGIDDPDVDFFARLGDYLLDSAGMNPSVGDKLLE